MMLGLVQTARYDAFSAWWQRQGEWVEEPNLRRGGESGVQRLRDLDGTLCYVKRQVGHTYRSLLHPLGRPTILREAAALRAWSQLGVHVPCVRYCGARRQQGSWQALLVSEALEGFEELPQWQARDGRPQVLVTILQRLGRTLARLHQARWQHGCLYPKHIFVAVNAHDEVELALLDLEKSRRRWSKTRAARHDLRQLRRHSPRNDADWAHLLQAYAAERTQLLTRTPA